MKKDRYKTKEQLINEIQELRKQLTDLKGSDTQSQPVKETSFILEEALQESEESYRVLTEKTMAGIYLVQDGKFRYVNPAFEQIHGYTSDETIDKLGPTDLAIPEDRDFLKEKIRQRISGEIETDYFQLRIKRKDGTIRYLEVYGSRANFKGRPSVLGTCIDITARKEAEEALRESEEHYKTLFNEILDGICLADAETGIIIDCNQALAALVCRERAELIGQPQTILHPPQDDKAAFSPTFKQHLTDKKGQILEAKIVTKTGEIREVEIKANLLNIQGRKMLHGLFHDITELKRVEKQLHYEKERFFTISENAPFGMIMTDKDGNFIYVNSKFKEIFGYDLNDIPDGRTWFRKAYPDPEYRHTVVSGWIDELKEKKVGEKRPKEFIVTCKDGTKKIIGFIAVQLKTGGNITSCKDITSRKQAEEALQQSEEKYRVLIETTDTGYLILDAQGRVIDANKEYIRLTGYGALEEILGRGVVEWTAPYDLERNAAEVKRCVEQGYVRNLEIDYVNRSGQITPIELNATVLASGDSARILSLCRDITDRRRIEQKLKESEEKYRNIFEHAVEGIFQSTPEGKFLSVNFAMAKMYGYTSPEEMVNSITDIGTQYYVDPKRRIEFRHLLDTQDIVEGFELEAYRKDGSKIWVSENVRAVQDGEGKLLYYEGTIEDITEQKQAIENLRTLEELESSVLSAIPHAVIGLKERKIIFANNAVETVFGWKPEELIGKNTRVLYRTEEEYKEIGKHFYPVLEKQQTYSEDFPCRRKDGKDMLCRVSTSRIGESLKERQIVVMYEDITEQKQAQMLLYESEEKYRSIVEYAVEGIYQTTRGGQLIVANKSFLQMLGYDSFEELTERIRDIGKQLYVELGQREELMRMLDKQNVVSGFETQLYRKDGSTIWVSFKVRAVRDSGGNILYNEGTMEDITYRKQAEESIRQNMDRLRKAIGGTIDVIAMAVEVRDPYTSGHQRRVSSLGRSIAKEMDLSQEVTDGIRMAGVIHDLGKISIPAEILSMPRKLTELEFGFIKTHPQIGYDMLKDIEFPYPIAQIVLQHHERLDGSGYPKGLKGEDIILEAKILAVADVVEAIASHRPYRPALGMDIALKEIIQNKGILYDPQVVEVCVKLFENNGFKFE